MQIAVLKHIFTSIFWRQVTKRNSPKIGLQVKGINKEHPKNEIPWIGLWAERWMNCEITSWRICSPGQWESQPFWRTERTFGSINALHPSTSIRSPILQSSISGTFKPTFPKPSKLSLAMSQNRQTQKSGNGRESITKHPSHTFNLSYRGVRLLFAADLTPHCGKSHGLNLGCDWSKHNWFYTLVNPPNRFSCFILGQPYINLRSNKLDKFSSVNHRERYFFCPITKFAKVWDRLLISLR